MDRITKHKFPAVRYLPCNHGLGITFDSSNNELDRINEGNKGDKEECEHPGLLLVHFNLVFWNSLLLYFQRP